MTQSKISGGQVVLLLYLSRMFTLLAAAPLSERGEIGGGMAAVAALASFGFQLLLFYPGGKLMEQHGGQNFAQASAEVFGRAGKACALLFWLVLMVQAGLSAAEFEGFLLTAVYEDAPGGLFSLLFLAAAIFGAAVGLEAFARFSVFGLTLFLFLLVSLFAGLLPDVRISELFAAQVPSVPVFLRTAWSFASGNLELLCFFLLLPQIRGERSSGKGLFYLWSGLYLLTGTALLLLVTCVIGGSSDQGRLYPFYTLAMAAEGTLLARMDAVHMSVWSVLGLLRCCLLLYCANIALRCALPVPLQEGMLRYVSQHREGVTAVGALLAALAMGIPWVYEPVRFFWRGGGAVTVVLGVIPVAALFWEKLRKAKRRKNP